MYAGLAGAVWVRYSYNTSYKRSIYIYPCSKARCGAYYSYFYYNLLLLL